MLKAAAEIFPEAKYQRCIVHFYRNVFSVVSAKQLQYVYALGKRAYTSFQEFQTARAIAYYEIFINTGM